MWKDPIVEAIRAYRDEHSRSFQYDADAIFADLLRSQAAHADAGVKFVNFEPRRPARWQASTPADQAS